MSVLAQNQITLSVTVDVDRVETWYKLQLTTATAPSKPTVASPTGWSSTEPAYDGTQTNTLYTCQKTVLTDSSFYWGNVCMSSSYEAAKQAANMASAASTAATNTQKYFFHDSDGAHVTTVENNATSGPDTLVDANGLHIRDATTDVAKFLDTGAQIGKDSEAHLVMDYNSMELQDDSNSTFLFIGDLRDENGEYELSETFAGDGAATEFYPRYNVSNFVSVTINGVETSDYTYEQPDWDWAVVFATAPADGDEIVVDYITTDLVPVQTFGGRSGTIGEYSTAEGYDVVASGMASHAEGGGRNGQMGGTVEASGMSAHAEGFDATASGNYSHAEGRSSASGNLSHAEGSGTASGPTSHAEGAGLATGNVSHAEGSGTASGVRSHAEGLVTEAAGDNQHVSGKYNVVANSYAEIIGNGTSAIARSNARTLDWDGNEELQGELYLGGCTANSETPEPAVRYNTTDKREEYYDSTNQVWGAIGGAGCIIYGGSKVITVTATREPLVFDNATIQSMFNVVSGKENEIGIIVTNGDYSAQGKRITSLSKRPAGWYVFLDAAASAGAFRFNYIVVVPKRYSTV